MKCALLMKKWFCCLLAAALLIPSATAQALVTVTARELEADVLVDGKPLENMSDLRDGADDTAWTPRKNRTVSLTLSAEEGDAVTQVYMRMDQLPETIELQTSADGRKWQGAGKVQFPGAEFVLSVAPTERLRMNITFSQAVSVNVTELRTFGPGALPEDLHAWRAPEAADILLLADDLAQADAAMIAQWTAEGRSAAVGCLSAEADGLLARLDALWDAGLRIAPMMGGFRTAEGDGAARVKAWGEKTLLKTLTGWIRRCQPLLLVQDGPAAALLAAQAAANAKAYRYEVSNAAAWGLWIVPAMVNAADVTADMLGRLPARSDEALREWCMQDFISAQHGDLATIPYPADRQADGYLTAGEFVHEDPENGLWAYLSSTVQVEIIRYEQPEVPRVWFVTDLHFKPESEKFQQVLYANAAFKDQQIYPDTLAQASKMVLAINADYYPYRLERKQSAGNILRQGVAMYDYDPQRATKYPNLDTVAFTDAGTLEVFHANETTATALAARGDVHDAMSFGPYLARDGKLRIYDGMSWDATEPRTAIGMVAPGHFRILTVEGRMPKKGHQGMNINELAMLMYAQGVTDACSLDGGNTSVLIFMGTKLNLTGKGTSIGQPRNQHELFGVGTSDLTHTDKLNKR